MYFVFVSNRRQAAPPVLRGSFLAPYFPPSITQNLLRMRLSSHSSLGSFFGCACAVAFASERLLNRVQSWAKLGHADAAAVRR